MTTQKSWGRGLYPPPPSSRRVEQQKWRERAAKTDTTVPHEKTKPPTTARQKQHFKSRIKEHCWTEFKNNSATVTAAPVGITNRRSQKPETNRKHTTISRKHQTQKNQGGFSGHKTETYKSFETEPHMKEQKQAEGPCNKHWGTITKYYWGNRGNLW